MFFEQRHKFNAKETLVLKYDEKIFACKTSSKMIYLLNHQNCHRQMLHWIMQFISELLQQRRNIQTEGQTEI